MPKKKLDLLELFNDCCFVIDLLEDCLCEKVEAVITYENEFWNWSPECIPECEVVDCLECVVAMEVNTECEESYIKCESDLAKDIGTIDPLLLECKEEVKPKKKRGRKKKEKKKPELNEDYLYNLVTCSV